LSAGREEQVEECIPSLIPLVVLHGKIQKYLVAEVEPQIGPHTAPVVALVRNGTGPWGVMNLWESILRNKNTPATG